MSNRNNENINGLTYLPGSNSVNDLDKVRQLMNNFLEIVGQNRQIRIDLENRAASVLEHEREKVKLLAAFAEVDPEELLDQEQGNGKHEFSGSKTINIDDLTKEKIKLQVELQQHTQIGEECTKLIESYKTTLAYMKVLIESHTIGHNQAFENLESSLKQNVENEDQTYQKLEKKHKEVRTNIGYLKESLVHAETFIKHAIEPFEKTQKNEKQQS